MDGDAAVTVHRPGPAAPQRVLDLAALLGLADGVPAVHVVDVGANPLDDVPPYLPLLRAGLARVTGFEPQAGAPDRLRRQAGPHERYLPYALGDGGVHELRGCAAEGFSSLLEPDPDQLAVLTDFPALAAVTSRTPVPTRRLDDVAREDALGPVDLLTVDAQGSEPAILAHGRTALAGVLAVQVEVAMHRLYRDGPLLADVDAELRGQGLVPHALVSTRTWPLAPVAWADPLQATARHLVEADLLYLRDPRGWGDLAEDRLRALVLLAAAAYGEDGTGLVALRHLVDRGVLAPDAETVYRRSAVSPRDG